MKVAVLGGGHGCYAAAADLSEQGHEVRLWRRDTAQLQPLLDRPVMTLKDEAGERDIPIAKVCADIGEAIAGADLVLIPSPAIAQTDIARVMAPHLTDGQVVFLRGRLDATRHRLAVREPDGHRNVALHDMTVRDDRSRRDEKSTATPLARLDRNDRRNRSADDIFQARCAGCAKCVGCNRLVLLRAREGG